MASTVWCTLYLQLKLIGFANSVLSQNKREHLLPFVFQSTVASLIRVEIREYREQSKDLVNKKGAIRAFFVCIVPRSFNLCLFRNLLRSTNLEQIKLKLFVMRHSKQILLTQGLEIIVGNLQSLRTTYLGFPAQNAAGLCDVWFTLFRIIGR